MSPAPPLRNYTIPGPAGPLEVLHHPAAPGPERGAALVLHPHPLYGGSMHTRVVHHIARALHESGLATLRLNFRGVGLSAGEHDAGEGEAEDARCALDHLASRHPGTALAIAGHSFGAWVGLRVGAAEARVRRMIGVGLPLDLFDFSFLAPSGSDILLVQGDADPFGAAAAVEALAARVGGIAVILPGGDHLLEGRIDALRAAIREHLGGAPPPPGRRETTGRSPA